MPLLIAIQKDYPSQVTFSYSVFISCTSPKQEEAVVRGLAAALGGTIVKPENENEESESRLLTHREKTILELLLLGLTCKQIGEKLFLSTATVEDHRKHIYRKLRVHNRATLLNMFRHRADGNSAPY
jgi:DNA-binding NarL/FixJ family response regulator